MRKLILTLFSLALVSGVVFAQADLEGLDGKKAMKKASRAFNKFNLDQTNAGDDLLEAKEYIDYAIKQEDIKMDPEVWVTMGDVYNGFAAYNQARQLLDPNAEALEPNGGMIAFQAYKKALELEEGNKNALDGLTQIIGSISNAGLDLYEQGDYQGAFSAFRSILDIHDMLKKNGGDSPLDNEADYDNQLYITGMAALSAGDNATAKSFMSKLYEKEYDKPAVYDAMYKLTIEEDVDKAEEILNKAREKYPDDVGLLFSEINHYLRLEKIDVLEQKLIQAIEKEPENPSLYSTLGNVYDRLYQQAYRDSSFEEADEYFSLAKEYYGKAIEYKPDYTDAIYSVGALYYNKAAIVTEEMNALADDYSKEGTEKFNQKKIEVEELFNEALPYFKEVESLDPSDRNTLIALKEIYARENNFEVSNEFKERLARIEAGETIEKSYFKE